MLLNVPIATLGYGAVVKPSAVLFPRPRKPSSAPSPRRKERAFLLNVDRANAGG